MKLIKIVSAVHHFFNLIYHGAGTVVHLLQLKFFMTGSGLLNKGYAINRFGEAEVRRFTKKCHS